MDILSIATLQRLKEWHEILKETIPATLDPFDESLYATIQHLLAIPRYGEDFAF